MRHVRDELQPLHLRGLIQPRICVAGPLPQATFDYGENLLLTPFVGHIETLNLAIGVTNIRDNLSAGVVMEVK